MSDVFALFRIDGPWNEADRREWVVSEAAMQA
jgi:hypothetical protein